MIDLFYSSYSLKYILIFIFVYVMALCVAMSFHEFSHAYIAKTQGDHTAKILGRCTLAPHAHIDWKGILCLLLFRFGWAKPVPVDERNFKNGKTSKFLVSIAGISMNLALGILFMFIYYLILKISPSFYESNFYGNMLNLFLRVSVQLNFSLAFFNLIPIYPLDGFRIVETFSKPNNQFVDFMRKYSFIIYIVLIVSNLYYYYYYYTANQLIGLFSTLFSKILGV